jgi:hypothetical protein
LSFFSLGVGSIALKYGSIIATSSTFFKAAEASYFFSLVFYKNCKYGSAGITGSPGIGRHAQFIILILLLELSYLSIDDIVPIFSTLDFLLGV